MAARGEDEESPLPLTLSRFQLSEEYGFLLPNPLTELPAPYGPWMEIAGSLPQLIASRQLRSRLRQMPQLSTRDLRGREELHLAHLVLSFLTMGYLWQEGEEGALKVLPRNLAIPFWEVSQSLGLPPILSHADFVLANWKRKRPSGPLEIENLDTIISLPGGESLRGFILVTLLVEKAAVPGIKAIVEAINALPRLDEEALHKALQQLAGAIGDMGKALRRMHDYVDPAVFYSVIRIFLSGWKDNPAMPHGLVYEGVSQEPMAFSGGSAAQSTVLHAFDELLGIRHSQESRISETALTALTAESAGEPLPFGGLTARCPETGFLSGAVLAFPGAQTDLRRADLKRTVIQHFGLTERLASAQISHAP
nr:indoleamine 2,3-dioxygenase 2 isoform X3 [Dromaius novaehollandiae]